MKPFFTITFEKYLEGLTVYFCVSSLFEFLLSFSNHLLIPTEVPLCLKGGINSIDIYSPLFESFDIFTSDVDMEIQIRNCAKLLNIEDISEC